MAPAEEGVAGEPPRRPEAAGAAAGARAPDGWSGVAAGVRRAAPLSVAAFGFAVSFGVLATAAGLPALATLVMSLTTFAGSAQFAAVAILGAGGAVTGAIVTAVLLNGRYLATGASVAPVIRGGPLRRLVEAQLVVDESWAFAHRGGGRFDRGILIGAGLLLYVAWNLGTLLGALGGAWLGDPERFGLDAAFPALFLALVAAQVSSRRALACALLGAGIALALTPFAPPGVPIIAATAACLLGWRK
jgi:4-azaleucine resistance transporter AzlC